MCSSKNMRRPYAKENQPKETLHSSFGQKSLAVYVAPHHPLVRGIGVAYKNEASAHAYLLDAWAIRAAYNKLLSIIVKFGGKMLNEILNILREQKEYLEALVDPDEDIEERNILSDAVYSLEECISSLEQL